jgi:hypothetical protein
MVRVVIRLRSDNRYLNPRAARNAERLSVVSHSSLVRGTLLALNFKGPLRGGFSGISAGLLGIPTYTHEN